MSIFKHSFVFVFFNLLSAPSYSTGNNADDIFDLSLEELLALEIVEVTAQKFKQPLNQVPIAITALTNETIELFGSQNTADLQWMVPGLTFTQSLSSSAVFLRGVGSSYSAAGGESPIAFYMDDVYLTSTAAAFFNLYNTELIEVIKGPQGTLFGRNATGGVVHVRTKEPTKTSQIYAELEAGDHGLKGVEVLASGQISEHFNGLFTTKYSDHSGFGKNQVTGANTFYNQTRSSQVKLSGELADVNVKLSIDHSVIDDMDGVALIYSPNSINAFTKTVLYQGDHNTTGNIENSNKNTQTGLNLRLSKELDWGQIKSISAIRNTGIELVQDGDRTPLSTTKRETKTSSKAVTQELQILAPIDNQFQWIAGVYFMDETSKYHLPDTKLTTSEVKQSGTQADTTSIALFGQSNYALSEYTTATVGLRYTQDKRNINDTQLLFYNDINGNVISTSSTDSAQGKWNKTTWRLAVDHQLSSNVLIYISQNRGFKAGLFNVSPFNSLPVAPEIIDATEVGVKSTLFDKRLNLNMAAFNYDYQNLQVQGNTTIGDSVFNILFNAASATVQGLEIESEALVSQALTLKAGLAILNGQYNEIYGVPFATPNTDGGNNIESRNLVDAPLYRTPDVSANLAAAYNKTTQYGTFRVNSSISYNSEYHFDAAQLATQEELLLINVSLKWQDNSNNWYASVWGRNLLDKLKYTNANAIKFGNVFSPDEPRMIGLTLGYHF